MMLLPYRKGHLIKQIITILVIFCSTIISGQQYPPFTNYTDFLYFTQSEVAGGGPYSGQQVYFYSTNTFDGYLYSQSDVYIYTCPTLQDSSIFFSSGEFNINCGSRFIPNVDSIPVPNVEVLYPIIETDATHIFDAGIKLNRLGMEDTLIMTEIKFVPNGFIASQWDYLIPPVYFNRTNNEGIVFDSDTIFNQISPYHIGLNHPFSNGYSNVDQVIYTLPTGSISQNLDVKIDDVMKLVDENNNRLSFKVTTIDSVILGYLTFYLYNGYVTSDVEIEFIDGDNLTVQSYSIDQSVPFNNQYYYHNHFLDGLQMCNRKSMHHYYFPKPTNTTDYEMPPTFFETSQSLIYVKKGQVLVSGKVSGTHAIVTDLPNQYKLCNLDMVDSVFNNIWIVDDLIYDDSDTITGEVSDSTNNKMFLISGSNIIIANTLANGAGNSLGDVKINAGLLALNESFLSQYWQNTTTNYSQPNFSDPSLSFGDGIGDQRFGPSTGQIDNRGNIQLWGSIFQKHRGHVRRHGPNDPYDLPSPGIGYYKHYSYDHNLFNNIPEYLNAILVIPTGPVAHFSPDSITGIIPLTVEFIDHSTPFASYYPIISWFWNFGDGSFSLEQNPVYTYSDTGYFDVTLTVTDILGLSNSIRVDSCVNASYTLNTNPLNDHLPESFSYTAYPNPFNNNIKINYQIPQKENVSIEIYSLIGKKVITLINEHQLPGKTCLLWNGCDERSNPVSSGIYFIRFKTEDFQETKKIVLLK